MSADNQYIILREDDGTFTVRMIMAPENYGDEEWLQEFGYKDAKDAVRKGCRILYHSDNLSDAYIWAHREANSFEGYAEYGVSVWCPYKVSYDGPEEGAKKGV